MKISSLEQHWEALMLLCRKEEELAAGTHPKLLRLVQSQIAVVAADLGFDPRQIATREFRAERSGGRIVRVITN